MDTAKLYTPLEIGSMKLRNRIVMGPMTLGLEAADGTVPERYQDFWEARAKGGVSLIILDVVTVDGNTPYMGNTIGLYHDDLIQPLKKFTDKIHAYDTRVIPQLAHPGPETIACLMGGQAVGPSPYVNAFGQMVRELKPEEISVIVRQYGEAARRAREGGCDGVQLHCAHAYLMAGAFLSPLRNKRTDRYGGGLDGRATMAMEIIKSIKDNAGQDFPIVMRISGDETTEGGNSLADMLYLAPKFAEAGADCFEVSGGTQYETSWRILPAASERAGINVAEANAIKKMVNVPVIVVGKINDARYAESVVQNGYADAVVMARALLTDAELPKKAMEGRYEDIAPCTGCSVGCLARDDGSRETATCVINPAVGKEKEMELVPADVKKKVLVAGGGIGGLEAARTAALRGHDVTLYEKAGKLGGQVNLAAVPPLKQDLSKWIVYLSNQVYKAGVKVELNKEATAESIAEAKPDVLIAAVGARPLIPGIRGVDNRKVVTGSDVLEGKALITQGNTLVIGGGMVGCEVAELLYHYSRGKTSVTIAEMLGDIAMDVFENSRKLMLSRLDAKGTTVLTDTKITEISDEGVTAERDGKQEVLKGFDHIVLCCGSVPAEDYEEKFKGAAEEVYVIGDAKSARKALHAVEEAAMIARKI